MKRVSRRITGRGGMLSALAIGQFFLAVHFSNNLVFLSSFFCLSLVVAAIPCAWNGLSGILVRVVIPDPVAVGGSGSLDFYVERGASIEGLMITARKLVAVPAGDESRRLCASIDTRSRGILVFENLTLSTCDPFGLFRVSRPLTPEEAPDRIEIAIYPRPDRSNPAPASVERSDAGASRARANIAGLRPYRAGDHPSDISWRATARHQSFVVKEYESAGSDNAKVFDFDTVAGEALEPALSRLTASVIKAFRDGAATGLRLPGAVLPPSTGETHQNRILTALASFSRTKR